ncbi:purine and uridine phosphorylase [Aspergillus keveii]|uniref:Purine and uridine phosphorylase n=1 Tax=Aspergillus keveii TaxID=714993 RepID=A0ABR4FJS3_9EURO
MPRRDLRRPDPADPYTVGWICARDEEYMCACRMLDEELPAPELLLGDLDDNTYVFGRIGTHYVVVTCLPAGRYGGNAAVRVARDMVHTFPKLQFALSVGIAGGAPTAQNDIRLGDVVVGVPSEGHPAVIEYDFGHMFHGGRFEPRQLGGLNGPPKRLLQVIPEMQRRDRDIRQPDGIADHFSRLRDMKEYRRPAACDKLYDGQYAHVSGGKGCERCQDSFTVQRPQRNGQRAVHVHYGTIGSGNTDLQDSWMRDSYANDPRMNFLCFDMESAGLMNSIPCLPIRGISNYCDSHTNDEWNHYAALTAASYAREFLLALPAQQPLSLRKAR